MSKFLDPATERWFRVREQLDIVDEEQEGVFAFCPECSEFIGRWPEGGQVEPMLLWYGVFRCECGWQPKV